MFKTIEVFVLASFQVKSDGLRGAETITVTLVDKSEGVDGPISFIAITQTTTWLPSSREYGVADKVDRFIVQSV